MTNHAQRPDTEFRGVVGQIWKCVRAALVGRNAMCGGTRRCRATLGRFHQPADAGRSPGTRGCAAGLWKRSPSGNGSADVVADGPDEGADARSGAMLVVFEGGQTWRLTPRWERFARPGSLPRSRGGL